MKILSVSNCPLNESQGSGYVILNFARGLSERGHQVDVFGPEHYEPLSFLGGTLRRYRLTAGMLGLSLSKLAAAQYDIIEFYGGESWLAASFINRIRKKRPLLVSHSNGLETHLSAAMRAALQNTSTPFPPGGRWKDTFIERAFTEVDGIVTVSDNDRNFAIAQNYQDSSHIVSINNALPAEFIGQEIDLDRVRAIGFCGTWLTRKGIDLVKTDITRILCDFPDWSFTLIGAGPHFAKEQHFPADVCSRINLIPFLSSKQQLKEAYRSLSIVIVPSLYEGFCLVTAEAMACGCAVVATKTGFAAALDSGEEALVLEKAQTPQLYEAVARLIVDDCLRRKIALGGHRRVQQLKWQSSIDCLETTYQKWLSELSD